MGRKARATKAEVMKQTSALESLRQLPISAVGGDLLNASADPTSGTPHAVLKSNLKSAVATIRRSQRVKKTTHNQEIEQIIQEIDISESEKEELPPFDEDNENPDDSADKLEDNRANIKYKSMYIRSQKKIEALLEKNRGLNKNLEQVVGKVKMYEKQSHIYGEVMTVIASLCKMNESLFAQVKVSVAADTATEDEGTVSKKKKTG